MLEEDPRTEKEILSDIENWMHAQVLISQRIYDVLLLILTDANDSFGKGVKETHADHEFVTDFPFKTSDGENV